MQQHFSKHIIDRSNRHFGWNREIEPALIVSPGAVVEIDAVDAGGGQLTRHSTLRDVETFNFDKVNPTFGPIFVKRHNMQWWERGKEKC